MPMKAVITKKEDIDALAEPVRALYTETNGKWILSVEGLVPDSEVLDLKTKLSEFRDSNRSMHSELERLRPLETKFKDVDPEEYKTLKSKVTELENKGIKSPDDLTAAINAALKPVNDRLAATEQARVLAQTKADQARFRELITADATKRGVKPSGLRHVLREAEDVFKLKDDGTLEPKPGVKHPVDPLKEMTPADWLDQLATTDDYLFGESVGGGANGGRPGPGLKPGVKELVNPSPLEMGRNADAIAKGDIVVVRR